MGVVGVDHVDVVRGDVVEEADHLGGRVLEIIVHDDRIGARHLVETSHDGVVLAYVLGQGIEADDAGIAPVEVDAGSLGVVGRIVVDEDDLWLVARGLERLDQLAHDAPDGVCAVVDGDYYGDFHTRLTARITVSTSPSVRVGYIGRLRIAAAKSSVGVRAASRPGPS